MLGGHLDSWQAGTGATDNGAGCAVMMEAVRIIQALGLKPRRTIRIAFWTGEEQGLLGSREYVEEAFRLLWRHAAAGLRHGWWRRRRGRTQLRRKLTKLPEYDKFSAYFNIDNGTGKIRGVYMQGNEGVRPIFRKWLDSRSKGRWAPTTADACRTPAAPTTSLSTPSACRDSSSSRTRSNTTRARTIRTWMSLTASRPTI